MKLTFYIENEIWWKMKYDKTHEAFYIEKLNMISYE